MDFYRIRIGKLLSNGKRRSRWSGQRGRLPHSILKACGICLRHAVNTYEDWVRKLEIPLVQEVGEGSRTLQGEFEAVTVVCTLPQVRTTKKAFFPAPLLVLLFETYVMWY